MVGWWRCALQDVGGRFASAQRRGETAAPCSWGGEAHPRRSRRELGQAILDYEILLGVVTAVLSGMQTYVRRAIQARMVDAALRGLPAGSPVPQYEPYYLTSGGKLAVKTLATYNVSPGSVTGSATVTARSRCLDEVARIGCPQQVTGGAP